MIAFSIGAIVPLFPYFFGDSGLVLTLSALFSAGALVIVGSGWYVMQRSARRAGERSRDDSTA